MTAPISRRTGELAYWALERALEREERRNGGRGSLRPDHVRALRELATAAASSDDLGAPAAVSARGNNLESGPLPEAPWEWLEVAEAARRAGVSARCMRWRAQHGKIPARRVADRWLVRLIETSKREAAA
jgi:hypothetical protein